MAIDAHAVATIDLGNNLEMSDCPRIIRIIRIIRIMGIFFMESLCLSHSLQRFARLQRHADSPPPIARHFSAR